jgi:hypothetical protein
MVKRFILLDSYKVVLSGLKFKHFFHITLPHLTIEQSHLIQLLFLSPLESISISIVYLYISKLTTEGGDKVTIFIPCIFVIQYVKNHLDLSQIAKSWPIF